MSRLLSILFIATAFSCNQPRTIGRIERIDPALDNILSKDATIEIIADGYEWSEGPLWLADQQALLFSDVPANTVYKWTEATGAKVYLHPSGYTGTAARGGETGSNGLLLDTQGKLVLCQHGNRQVARMEAGLADPKPVFTVLAGAYSSKKFNSPNDAVYRSNGDLFFTDPPYGLEKNMDDPLKELSFQGVYRVNTKGEVKLLTDTITRPNGITLMPGEKTIIIANSDDNKPFWYMYDLDANDSLVNPRLFYDAPGADPLAQGGHDGMKTDKKGNVFATAAGGVWILDSTGKLLGKILIPGRTSNCALTRDEKTLFITADNYVLRVGLTLSPVPPERDASR